MLLLAEEFLYVKPVSQFAPQAALLESMENAEQNQPRM